jgi:DivIVA domain-containing protein
VVGGESPKTDVASAPEERGFGDLRHYVPADILDVSFPVAVRGYDRHAVDAYVKRVNRVIAELKVSASPPAAVRHALDQASGKVDSLLEAAREAAEQITTSAREDAEQTTSRAKAEAAELVVNTTAEADRTREEAQEVIAKARAEADETINKARAEAEETIAKAKAEADRILTDARAEAQTIVARSQAEADERLRALQEELGALRQQGETRMREIRADTQAIWQERHDLLEEIRRMSSGLADVAKAAAARVSLGEHEPEAGEPGEEATDQVTAPMATVGADTDASEPR